MATKYSTLYRAAEREKPAIALLLAPNAVNEGKKNNSPPPVDSLLQE
jgi:alpha/beta superfamily hydrolase